MKFAHATIPFAALLLAAAAAQADPRQLECHALTEEAGATLFDQWHADLSAGDLKSLVGRYGWMAPLRILPRGKALRTAGSKRRFFASMLARKPRIEVGKHHVTLKCNSLVDAGWYAIKYDDGTAENDRFRVTYS